MKRRDTTAERERRKEDRIPASFLLQYYFLHASEDRQTKAFRVGETRNVSRHGIFFLAEVIDPSIIPAAVQGDVQIAIRITGPGGRTLNGLSRLAWHEAASKDNPNQFFIGVEYLDFTEEDAQFLFDAALEAQK